MCNKAVYNYAYALEFVPIAMTQEICAVNISTSIMQFVPECYKTQEMCKKNVDFCPFVTGSVADCYKTQEICDKIASEDHFMLKYWFDRYKAQEMCDKAVAASLPLLKFILDLFVMKKMI